MTYAITTTSAGLHLRTASQGCHSLVASQETNHTQENPRQLRIVCPNLKNFLGGEQIVEGIDHRGMTPWRPLFEF